eukprot:TRINITY_DN11477_c0_g2_i1.p1 TRINITY_DN11477_c0_g2~~TRINITY_DN11477_c0_g2_i1.p1  ORF type:complete len:321 (+),score=41.03 TRINITY_DN11477_c0_g2_i1:160-1122(+)
MQARQKNLDFIIDIEEHVPAKFYCDKERIRQILINLMTNALKFTSKGSITFQIKMVENFCLRFGVMDTGIGIREYDQQRLLQSFGQLDVDEYAKMNNMGVGLGLMISSRIANLVGADKINFTSEYGKGSFFYIDITSRQTPVVEENIINLELESIPQVNPVKKYPLISLSNGNTASTSSNAICTCPYVLVADDNEYNRMVLVRMLKRKNMQSIEAYDGKQALEIIKERLNEEYSCGSGCRRFKVIISDLNMPVMTGYDLLKSIKVLQSDGVITKPIPFVVASAFEKQTEIDEGFKLGMDHYMTKPISESDISKLLDSIKS